MYMLCLNMQFSSFKWFILVEVDFFHVSLQLGLAVNVGVGLDFQYIVGVGLDFHYLVGF